jgi:hypothetical protein
MRIATDRCHAERRRSGPAIPRPVEGNQPDPLPGRELLPEAKVQPGTGGPVEVHHHRAIGITSLPDPQYPAAASYLHLAHLTIVKPPPPEINETS